MQFLKVLLLSLTCILLSDSVGAQERIKNRAENRANQRVDQKVDQAVDKAAGAIEGLFRRKGKNSNNETEPTETGDQPEETSSTAESEQGGILSRLSNNREFEPYENPILMNLSADITTIDKRGKENKVTVHYTFDTWATGMKLVSEEGTARILLNNQEGDMTIISENDGETQGMKMRQPSINYEELMPDQSEYTITPLDNFREIDGYNCREHLIEHEEGTTNAWITTDIDIDPEVIMRAMASQMRQKKNSSSQQLFNIPGLPIESTTVSANGKETVIARYYDLKFGDDIDKSIFDTSGVNIVNMGF